MPTDPPDPLDELLALNHETPTLDPLQPDVWRRISLTADPTEEAKVIPMINSWFARWPFAALFVASCALIGGLWAQVQANKVERQRSAQVVHSYMVLIDPLLQEIVRPSPPPRP